MNLCIQVKSLILKLGWKDWGGGRLITRVDMQLGKYGVAHWWTKGSGVMGLVDPSPAHLLFVFHIKKYLKKHWVIMYRVSHVHVYQCMHNVVQPGGVESPLRKILYSISPYCIGSNSTQLRIFLSQITS